MSFQFFQISIFNLKETLEIKIIKKSNKRNYQRISPLHLIFDPFFFCIKQKWNKMILKWYFHFLSSVYIRDWTFSLSLSLLTREKWSTNGHGRANNIHRSFTVPDSNISDWLLFTDSSQILACVSIETERVGQRFFSNRQVDIKALLVEARSFHGKVMWLDEPEPETE